MQQFDNFMLLLHNTVYYYTYNGQYWLKDK